MLLTEERVPLAAAQCGLAICISQLSMPVVQFFMTTINHHQLVCSYTSSGHDTVATSRRISREIRDDARTPPKTRATTAFLPDHEHSHVLEDISESCSIRRHSKISSEEKVVVGAGS